jgi:hypothetical protein
MRLDRRKSFSGTSASISQFVNASEKPRMTRMAPTSSIASRVTFGSFASGISRRINTVTTSTYNAVAAAASDAASLPE